MTINYDPNTPTPRLPYANWQIQFEQNFQQLALAFKKNHVAIDDATVANRGNHTYVQMPEQLTEAQAGALEFAVYSKDVSDQTDQVFFTYPGNSPVVQFTNYQIYSVPRTFVQSTYFTFLPGKLLVYFGGLLIPSRANNILHLNPPIAKNIVSVNFCLSDTTPNYTPASTVNTPQQNEQVFGDKSGLIKYVVISPDNDQIFPAAIFYTVVANI